MSGISGMNGRPQVQKPVRNRPVVNKTPEQEQQEKLEQIDRVLSERAAAELLYGTNYLVQGVKGNPVAEQFILVQRAIWLRAQLFKLGRQSGKSVTAIPAAKGIVREIARISECLTPGFQMYLKVDVPKEAAGIPIMDAPNREAVAIAVHEEQHEQLAKLYNGDSGDGESLQ